MAEGPWMFRGKNGVISTISPVSAEDMTALIAEEKGIFREKYGADYVRPAG